MVIKKSVLIIFLSTVALACAEQAQWPKGGQTTHITTITPADLTELTATRPTPPSYIQRERQYDKQYKKLLRQTNELTTENLLSQLKALEVSQYNSEQKYLLKTAPSKEVAFIKFKFEFKHLEQPLEFFINTEAQPLSLDKSYSSTLESGIPGTSYVMTATCVSVKAPACKVVAAYVTEHQVKDKASIKTGRVGFIYSKKQVQIKVKRATRHPVEMSPLVDDLVNLDESTVSTQEKISIAKGPTTSTVSISISDSGKELTLKNIVRPTDENDLSDESTLPITGTVSIHNADGTITPVTDASSDITGVDYINADSKSDNYGSHDQVTRIDLPEESLQIVTTDPDFVPTTIVPHEKRQSVDKKVSPKVFKIDLNNKALNNAHKQTEKFLNLDVDKYLQYHLNIISPGKKDLNYCQYFNIAKQNLECPDGSCKKNYRSQDQSQMAQQHINNMAALSPYLRQAYDFYDVTPIASNVMYVESAYTYGQNNSFPIANVSSSKVVGPFQFKPVEAKVYTKEIYKDLNINAEPHIFSLVGPGQTNVDGRTVNKITHNLSDDRAYLVPSAYLGAIFHSDIFKMIGNNPELLYLGYHLGEPNAAVNVACAQAENPEQCKKSLQKNKGSVMRALQCAGIDDFSKRRACFNKLPARYQVFDDTKMFDNSLKMIRKHKMVHCMRISETYKFLAISLVTMNPEKYGFTVNPTAIDEKAMKLYNPYR